MQTNISISDFKAHCLEIIANLQHSQKPLTITKHDKPVAKIEAISDGSSHSLFGLMADRATIKKDIIKPITEKWSCEND